MIEATIISYLNNIEGMAPAYAERPENIPPKYILVEKTGTSTENKITTSTIAVQAISDTLQNGSLLDAMQLNEAVKVAMADLVTLDSVSGVSLNSDYNFTDPTTKEYRYQAVFLITHY